MEYFFVFAVEVTPKDYSVSFMHTGEFVPHVFFEFTEPIKAIFVCFQFQPIEGS
jgi:hypothetical protein